MRGSRHGVWLAVLRMTGVVLAAAGLAIGAVPAAGDSGTSNPACPASNPPNALSLAGGSPQTALLHTAFGANLQVALANTNGCPLTSAVAGVPVTFSAPASGASGTFASSGSSSVTVGSDASGMASGAMFSANGSAGSYTIVASSAYGSVSFAMTNTAAGMPAALKVVGRTSQSATVSTRFKHPLEVRLLDANGSALASVSVTFTLGAGGGGSGASGAGNSGAGATFTSGVSQAVVTTDSSGIAVSPHVVADSTAGHFTATATLTGGTKLATFALTNRAGAPRRVTAGAAASESARTGTRFPIRLGVAVTDADANPVPGAVVTFSAPVRGASGTFERSGKGRTRVVRIRTNALGIAVAPVFTANRAPGGYAVKASIGHAVTAFALVNEPLEQPT